MSEFLQWFIAELELHSSSRINADVTSALERHSSKLVNSPGTATLLQHLRLTLSKQQNSVLVS